MARLIRPTKRALFSPICSSHSKPLIQQPSQLSLHHDIIHDQTITYNLKFLLQQTRGYIWQQPSGYISERQKSVIEGNVLLFLRNEIQYELDQSPPTQPVPNFNSFEVEEKPGEQWIRLNKKFGHDEVIKVEGTMIDGSAPVKKTGGIVTADDVDLYISVVIDICKGEGSDVLQFECIAWPNGLVIGKVFMRGQERMACQPYHPPFYDLDDALQESLYVFLETRGINYELAVFLHKYMQNKRKIEFIRWMENVKSFIEKKL